MSFREARVLSFESRRAAEMAELIKINGGEPFVAPALVEVPLEHNAEVFDFADRLYADEFEMIIFLTGVGTRLLSRVLATRDPEEQLVEALRKKTIVVRGPKPSAVMREWGVPVAVTVPEPNTWRELLVAVRDRPERAVAVQEYGRPSTELLDGLAAQQRTVTTVPVYQWKLPPDTAPLVEAVRRLVAGTVDVVLFTTAVQLDHLLELAGQAGKEKEVMEALQRAFIGSIGPTCTETLQHHGLHPALEPSHPKMGILVREAALAYSQNSLSNSG